MREENQAGLSTKQRIVKNISKTMFIREDVVNDIVNAYIEQLIVETVNRGKVSIENFVSVSSYQWSSYKISNREEEIGEHWRLRSRISKNLRTLFKNFGPESANPNIITVNNWRKLLEVSESIKTPGAQPDLSRKKEKKEIKEEQKVRNPFL